MQKIPCLLPLQARMRCRDHQIFIRRQRHAALRIAADGRGRILQFHRSALPRTGEEGEAVAGHGDAGKLTYEYVINETRLKDVNAVKNGRVYMINTDLASRPAPRIVDALEQMAGWVQA